MSRPIIVALHGVGSSAEDMAVALRPLEAMAEVIALPGHEPFDGGGQGRQWFSVAGVTDANRPARVAVALPLALAQLDHIAAARGVSRDDLVLVGFSQGAILALAAVAAGDHRGRAVAIAGRLAAPVVPAQGDGAEALLVHDVDDPVMPVALATEAASALSGAGHHVDEARTSGIGHRIGPPTITAVAEWLFARTQSFGPVVGQQGRLP